MSLFQEKWGLIKPKERGYTLKTIYKLRQTEHKFRLVLNQIKIKVQRTKPKRDSEVNQSSHSILHGCMLWSYSIDAKSASTCNTTRFSRSVYILARHVKRVCRTVSVRHTCVQVTRSFSLASS